MNDKDAINCPFELMEFLRKDTYSLLIKGEPGVGKTTLCLTILKLLNIKRNFFYISTRISPTKLLEYHQWIGDFLNINESDDNLKPFEDARLDEPESLFERITNQLMDVRSPLIIIDSWEGIASFMDKESRLNNERVLQTWLERAGGRLILANEGTETSSLDYLVDGIINLKKKDSESKVVVEVELSKLRGVKMENMRYCATLHNAIFNFLK
ncbi:MAG: RAD55 family ATPase [Nitrososphaeraceae archaeon]